MIKGWQVFLAIVAAIGILALVFGILIAVDNTHSWF